MASYKLSDRINNNSASASHQVSNNWHYHSLNSSNTAPSISHAAASTIDRNTTGPRTVPWSTPSNDGENIYDSPPFAVIDNNNGSNQRRQYNNNYLRNQFFHNNSTTHFPTPVVSDTKDNVPEGLNYTNLLQRHNSNHTPIPKSHRHTTTTTGFTNSDSIDGGSSGGGNTAELTTALLGANLETTSPRIVSRNSGRSTRGAERSTSALYAFQNDSFDNHNNRQTYKSPAATAHSYEQQQQYSSSGGGIMSHHNSNTHYTTHPLSGGGKCCRSFLIVIIQILLNSLLGLCLFWLIQFHSRTSDGRTFGFWDYGDAKLMFNLHPILMLTGMVYLTGQALMMYRTCLCCRRVWNKVLHTVFHILSIPCVVFGFMSVFYSREYHTDSHGNVDPIPHFYSIHSWIGVTAMALFAIQFLFGFFCFIILLCCDSMTSNFRSALVPIHSAVGLSTFVLSVMASLCGLTEKAFFSLSTQYSQWVPYVFDRYFSKINLNSFLADTQMVDTGPSSSPKLILTDEEQNTLLTASTYTKEKMVESLSMNVQGAILILLAILVPFLISYPRFKSRNYASSNRSDNNMDYYKSTVHSVNSHDSRYG